MNEDRVSEGALLGPADAVLREAGFATRRAVLPTVSTPFLLAENEFSVIALVAARTLSDAKNLESFAVAALLELLAASGVGAKRWDAYVVLAVEESGTDSDLQQDLADLQNNTRGVRRLVSMGVRDREGLQSALRPLLPLPQPQPGGLSDALADLSDQLALNGINPEDAARYVAAFGESGGLDDI
jgi:hypothetical protein